MACFVVAGVMAATPAAAGKGGAPPGSNGTIKVEGATFDGGKDNDPHVSCPFQIDLWGFDAGADTATVSFDAQPPSKTAHGNDDQAVPVTSGSTTLSFTGTGDAQHLDASQTYTLDTTGLYQHPKQGFHIKVTVVVTSPAGSAAPTVKANGKSAAHTNNGNGEDKGNGNHGNQGTTTKYKVFWMGPCTTESSSSSSSSSTSSTESTTTQTTTESTSSSTSEVSATETTTTTTSSSSASVLGEKVTRKPPTTKVKATHVTQLPFTGLPSDVLRVLVPTALGLVLTGTGLVGATRRSRVRARA